MCSTGASSTRVNVSPGSITTVTCLFQKRSLQAVERARPGEPRCDVLKLHLRGPSHRSLAGAANGKTASSFRRTRSGLLPSCAPMSGARACRGHENSTHPLVTLPTNGQKGSRSTNSLRHRRPEDAPANVRMLSGGDFVRNIKQLVDLLRQIAAVEAGSRLGATAGAAAESLVRGVVAVSSGVGPEESEAVTIRDRDDAVS